MKALDFIPRAESVKEFFEFYHDSKFLIFDRSRLEEIDLLEILNRLSNENVDDYEFDVYGSGEYSVTYHRSDIDRAFKKSIGVVKLDNYLDDFDLFESEKALEEYVDDYRSSYLEDSIVFEVTGEMIDELLEASRIERIAFLKESIDYYRNEIDRMTKELARLEKI